MLLTDSRSARFWKPSPADFVIVAILMRAFVSGSGWLSLLADGDTGWHIRTGNWILQHGRVPSHDLFSFSKEAQPWFAWEWLSDVVFALLHQAAGLRGVVAFTGLVLCVSALLLFRWMLWRNAGFFVALAVTFTAVAASSVHFLARPHIFTFLFLIVSLWMLDRDRLSATPLVWVLVPLSAVWTNLHGGFLAWIACLVLLTATTAIQTFVAHRALSLPSRARQQAVAALKRYALLTALCSCATLVNPYGYRLHQHIIQYLQSSWISDAVEEFQSPKFRSENMLHFELLLFVGVLLAGKLLRDRRFFEAGLMLFWAQAALRSVRHVPLYAVAAAPLIASGLSTLWKPWAARRVPRSIPRVLLALDHDVAAASRRNSVWAVLAPAVILACCGNWPLDFPQRTFPVDAVNRNQAVLGSSTPMRLLTTDQWGDYLIYRFYPTQRVFVDGRSDFYGPGVGRDYLHLMTAHHDWEDVMRKYNFDVALLPPDWPLVALLTRQGDWIARYHDEVAVLLERKTPAPLKPKGISAELNSSHI